MPVIENNKELVPFEYYLDLYAKMDVAEVTERTGINYNTSEGCFEMRLLYASYRLYWPVFRIESDQTDALALNSIPAQIYLIRFLLEGKACAGNGSFLTYREMPWGDVYLTPFTGRCIKRAAFTFGTRIDAFRRACESMNAVPIRYGDAAYQIEVMPGFEIRMIVWEGDDEFPPNSQILFTDNFGVSLSAEDRTVTGDLVITEIKRRM